jgi:hypothetical protein
VTHTLRLERAMLAGTLELHAELVRRTDAPSRTPGFAHRAWSRLADARAWEIRVDRRRELGGVYLDVRYRSFKDDPVIPASDKQNLYRLELETEAPLLWLNADHEALSVVMSSQAQSGHQARLRDLAFDLVAPSVWTQLFLRAATDLVQAGEAVLPWQAAVVAQVGRLLYGEKRSDAELLSRLREALTNVPRLLSEVDAAMQRYHELSTHASRLATEAT